MAERLSQRFARMSAVCASERVTPRALVGALGTGDHALVTLLVGLCALPPIPMPGVSVVLALLALSAGVRLAFGRPLWLPSALLDRSLPAGPAGKLFSAAARVFGRWEGLIRPRGAALSAHRWSRQVNGAALAACGAMLLIPLPPPTNVPPAAALLALSIGLLEGDGLLLCAGYLAVLASGAFFGALAMTGWSGLRMALAKL